MRPSLSVATIFAVLVSGGIVSAHPEAGTPAPPTATPNESDGRRSSMRISIKLGAKLITASLADSATSRDFVSLLPMTIKLEDYAATEKIGYLPTKFELPAVSLDTVLSRETGG